MEDDNSRPVPGYLRVCGSVGTGFAVPAEMAAVEGSALDGFDVFGEPA